MDKKGQTGIIIGVVIGVIAITIISSVIIINSNRSITGQAISDLKDQLAEQNKILEEQGELTAEQQAQAEIEKKRLEAQIEELSKETCKDIQVPYDAEEEYTEQEPYLRTETYYESEPYAEEMCEAVNLAYNKVNNYCLDMKDNLIFADEPAKYSVTINNLDPENGGWFVVDIGFIIAGQVVKEEQSQYIYPSSSKTFYVEQMATRDSCYFVVTELPTKQICETVTKYKDVLKTREVTDYREVTKTRTVTKYRTETVCE